MVEGEGREQERREGKEGEKRNTGGKEGRKRRRETERSKKQSDQITAFRSHVVSISFTASKSSINPAGNSMDKSPNNGYDFHIIYSN